MGPEERKSDAKTPATPVLTREKIVGEQESPVLLMVCRINVVTIVPVAELLHYGEISIAVG